MRVLIRLVLCLGLAACSPAGREAADKGAEAVADGLKRDSAKLVDSTGDVLKKGAAELKEGAKDAADMVADKTSAVRDDLKDERREGDKKN